MSTSPPSAADIYRALKHNLGHELVTDENVEAVIEVAQEHGDVQTEYLLREWRSTCGRDSHMPDLSTIAHQVPPAGS